MVNNIWTAKENKEIVSFLQDLIKQKTINSHNNEMESVLYLAKIFETEGINYQIIESAPGRGNIVAWIKGGYKEPLIYISHLDVVDVDEEKWIVDPFSAEIIDNNIYGRGTLDTKQLTVMNLMTLLMVKRNNLKLNRDLIFIATADEENGSSYGMKYLVENYPNLIPKGYVVNEGGGFILPNLDKKFRICACGEKGVCEITYRISNDKNLLENLINIFEKVTNYESNEKLCIISKSFKDKANKYIEMDSTINNLWKYMTRDTLTINAFKFDLSNLSGDLVYEVKVTYRFLPGPNREEIVEKIDEIFEGVNLDYNISKFFEGYESNVDSDFIKILEDESNIHGEYAEILPIIALGNTDGRFIRHNVYGYSPLLEEDSFDVVLKKVHGNNESISIDSLIFGAKVILGTTIRIANI